MNFITDTLANVTLSDKGSVIFYYGTYSFMLQNLPAYAEFTLVYSPRDNNGWEATSYRVLADKTGYIVVENRLLTAAEIGYFKKMMTRLCPVQSIE